MAVQPTCDYHGWLSPAPPTGHGCCPLSFSLGAMTLDGLTPAPMLPAQCTQQVTLIVLCQEISPSQSLSPAPDCTETFSTSLGILAFTWPLIKAQLGPLLTKAGRAVPLKQHCPG